MMTPVHTNISSASFPTLLQSIPNSAHAKQRAGVLYENNWRTLLKYIIQYNQSRYNHITSNNNNITNSNHSDDNNNFTLRRRIHTADHSTLDIEQWHAWSPADWLNYRESRRTFINNNHKHNNMDSMDENVIHNKHHYEIDRQNQSLAQNMTIQMRSIRMNNDINKCEKLWDQKLNQYQKAIDTGKMNSKQDTNEHSNETIKSSTSSSTTTRRQLKQSLYQRCVLPLRISMNDDIKSEGKLICDLIKDNNPRLTKHIIRQHISKYIQKTVPQPGTDNHTSDTIESGCDELIDRIYASVNTKGTNSPLLEDLDFIKLYYIICYCTVEQQYSYLYDVCDWNDDGLLCTDDLFHMLQYGLDQLIYHDFMYIIQCMIYYYGGEQHTDAVLTKQQFISCITQLTEKPSLIRLLDNIFYLPYRKHIKLLKSHTLGTNNISSSNAIRNALRSRRFSILGGTPDIGHNQRSNDTCNDTVAPNNVVSRDLFDNLDSIDVIDCEMLVNKLQSCEHNKLTRRQFVQLFLSYRPPPSNPNKYENELICTFIYNVFVMKQYDIHVQYNTIDTIDSLPISNWFTQLLHCTSHQHQIELLYGLYTITNEKLISCSDICVLYDCTTSTLIHSNIRILLDVFSKTLPSTNTSHPTQSVDQSGNIVDGIQLHELKSIFSNKQLQLIDYLLQSDVQG